MNDGAHPRQACRRRREDERSGVVRVNDVEAMSPEEAPESRVQRHVEARRIADHVVYGNRTELTSEPSPGRKANDMDIVTSCLETMGHAHDKALLASDIERQHDEGNPHRHLRASYPTRRPEARLLATVKA